MKLFESPGLVSVQDLGISVYRWLLHTCLDKVLGQVAEHGGARGSYYQQLCLLKRKYVGSRDQT